MDDPPRWILHLDMDAFFASVEQLDIPEYRGKPLIIGGGERGVVATASYEARRFGVHSAMPMFQARRLCPQGIFIPGRMKRYREKSGEILAILDRFSPLVEPASIDEAYMDLSGLERLFGSVQSIAAALQRTILEETGLSCSLGVAPVKFLAKIASDLRKPAGLTILSQADVPAFLESLPVGKIPGVGGKTLEILESLGIRAAAEISRLPPAFWRKRLGKFGDVLCLRAQGLDPRPVEPRSAPKSESAENTFAKDLSDREELLVWLLRQAERVGYSLRCKNLAGRTITLKMTFSDFSRKTRSRTLRQPTNLTRTIYETARDLLDELKPERPLRLIGLGVSHFGPETRQLSLLGEAETGERKREAALDAALDVLRRRHGGKAVIRGRLFPGNAPVR
ncbi:MAG: DNA polymerase IV [Deltaproteobacteria bacterium]|jgi:DNA polymerase-4|nr:DNA polymerase IV [Deltaproteobacteria bacterium]